MGLSGLIFNAFNRLAVSGDGSKSNNPCIWDFGGLTLENPYRY
jgi:hypothetical protein